MNLIADTVSISVCIVITITRLWRVKSFWNKNMFIFTYKIHRRRYKCLWFKKDGGLLYHGLWILGVEDRRRCRWLFNTTTFIIACVLFIITIQLSVFSKISRHWTASEFLEISNLQRATHQCVIVYLIILLTSLATKYFFKIL